ncbi:transglutaminase domain-containing protein [Actinotalea ferrariae]|uniref:transglutaminase-like domain-containing protein n=1 Tax=Actinotalea ferrariae TaxID=1386098 RepID=UPI001C8B235E|nr:transglutaminase-like domain-containing protein [Actinotalea ferrariae]MBX9245932.1 transglutaminase domain-containing protein [Actinotalea ferrariae]
MSTSTTSTSTTSTGTTSTSTTTPDASPTSDVLDRYRRHTPLSDPGAHAPSLRALPAEPAALAAAVRGLVVHYVASGLTFTPERLADIDSRWVARMLERLAARDPAPLDRPREVDARVVGCCRDAALLYVAAARELGVPARSRVGFAPYLREGFAHDHVVAEHWDAAADGGGRWVRVDPQIDPAWVGVDTLDLGTGADSPFRTAAHVWLDHRAGRLSEAELAGFGVGPDLPLRGRWFVRNYVVAELAHLTGHELLLWDLWGAMVPPVVGPDGRLADVDAPPDPDLDALVDRVAEALVDPDVDPASLDALLDDPRLDPRRGVVCDSPSGLRAQVDLTSAG